MTAEGTARDDRTPGAAAHRRRRQAGRAGRGRGRPAAAPDQGGGRRPDPPHSSGRRETRANALILDRLAERAPRTPCCPRRRPTTRPGVAAPGLDNRPAGRYPRVHHAGSRDWAVHVALWEAGAGITAAAVALPGDGEVFATDRPLPARRDPARDAHHPGER